LEDSRYFTNFANQTGSLQPFLLEEGDLLTDRKPPADPRTMHQNEAEASFLNDTWNPTAPVENGGDSQL
jgi:hypothetical protein